MKNKNTGQTIRGKKTLFFFLTFLILIFLSQDSYAWWNTNWKSRRNITIDNTANPNTLTDYQIPINITFNTFCNTEHSLDFSCIRFTWFDETTGTEREIPYWIESKVDNSWAYVWVRVPHIPASGFTTVYVYYRNATPVASASDGDSTFIFFDDWTDINYDKWEIEISGTGSITVSDGIVTIRAGDGPYDYVYLRTHRNFDTTNLLEFNGTMPTVWPQHHYWGYGTFGNTILLKSSGGDSLRIENAKDWAWSESENFGYDGDWRVWGLRRVDTSHSEAFRNHSLLGTLSPNLPTVDLPVIFITYYLSAEGKMDWVRIRSFVQPEPTFSVGPEEEVTYQPYISSCSRLDVEGATYYLTQDISLTEAMDCMVITAKNVVLDCQGHLINGVSNSDYIKGIWVRDTQGVTVKNCVVRDFHFNIFVENSNSTIVVNNTVSRTSFISPDSTGIRLQGAEYAVVEDNEIYGNWNGTHWSMRFGVWTCCPPIKHSVFKNNYVHDVLFGMGFHTSVNITLISNNITAGRGICIIGLPVAQFIGTENYVVKDNTITTLPTFIGSIGIQIMNGTNILVENNTIVNHYPTLDRSSAIYNASFMIDAPSKDMVIRNNTIVSDLLLTITARPSDYAIENLTACHNRVDYNVSWDIPPVYINRRPKLLDVMRIESSSCVPYISATLPSRVDFGSVNVNQRYNATTLSIIDSNMINTTWAVRGDTDFSPDWPISSLSFTADKHKPYPTEETQLALNAFRYSFKFLAKETNIIENLWKLYVPYVQAGYYQATITLEVST